MKSEARVVVIGGGEPTDPAISLRCRTYSETAAKVGFEPRPLLTEVVDLHPATPDTAGSMSHPPDRTVRRVAILLRSARRRPCHRRTHPTMVRRRDADREGYAQPLIRQKWRAVADLPQGAGGPTIVTRRR